MCQRRRNRTQIGLRCQAAHGIHGTIDGIATGVDRCQHAGRTHAAGVMRMKMNRQADLIFQRPDQCTCCSRLAHACHIFDADDIHTRTLEFFCHRHVIRQTVFRTRRIERIARIANRAFAQRTSFTHRINGDPHIFDPV